MVFGRSKLIRARYTIHDTVVLQMIIFHTEMIDSRFRVYRRRSLLSKSIYCSQSKESIHCRFKSPRSAIETSEKNVTSLSRLNMCLTSLQISDPKLQRDTLFDVRGTPYLEEDILLKFPCFVNDFNYLLSLHY